MEVVVLGRRRKRLGPKKYSVFFSAFSGEKYLLSEKN
jgi:hypothetical protein